MQLSTMSAMSLETQAEPNAIVMPLSPASQEFCACASGAAKVRMQTANPARIPIRRRANFISNLRRGGGGGGAAAAALHTTKCIKSASGGNDALAGDAGGELAEGVHCGRYFGLKQTKADYALSRGVFANMRELSAFAPSFFREDWRDDESPPCRMPDLILPQPCGKVLGGALNAFLVVADKDDIAIHAVVVAGITADFHLRVSRLRFAQNCGKRPFRRLHPNGRGAARFSERDLRRLRQPRPGARSAFPPTPPNFPRGRGQRAALPARMRRRQAGEY